MSLAFLILAHKNPRQVARLFHAIHRPDDVIVLHFDRRAPEALHQLGRDLQRAHRNVIVLKPQVILWGGYRMAEVQIAAMAAALRLDSRWTHFVSLTGQDFPIKPLTELDAFLAARPRANFMTWFDPVLNPLWSNARDRLRLYYLEWPWLDRVLRLPGIGRRLRQWLGWQNRLPHIPRYSRRWPDFRYFGGANHVVLSREGCSYMSDAPEARRIRKWLAHSAHANEIVFQTVMLNSPLAGTVVNDHLHEIDFPPHTPHPRTWREADFDRLTRSSRFFARKFDAQTDERILDRLSEHLGLPAVVHQVVAHS